METWSKKEKWSAIYLSIIYLVGIAGIALPLHSDFIRLTPLNFVVSLLIVFFNQKNWNTTLITIIIANYGIGFLAEVIGVNGGCLFGDFYSYGAAMGFQVFKTPLTAGLLWVVVAMGVASLLNGAFVETSWFKKSVIGAAILVSLDVIIEPVATKLYFWEWQHQVVPLQNYYGWYIIALLILTLYNFFQPNFSNKIAVVLLIWQFIFFGFFLCAL
jgi:bisanhydrobacterioruberin hydratase